MFIYLFIIYLFFFLFFASFERLSFCFNATSCESNAYTWSKMIKFWCSYSTSFVIYYWTDARQHGIYLVFIIKKKIIQNVVLTENESRGCSPHFNKLVKAAIWHNLLSLQNEANSLVAYKSMYILWLVQRNHTAFKLDSSTVIFASVLCDIATENQY